MAPAAPGLPCCAERLPSLRAKERQAACTVARRTLLAVPPLLGLVWAPAPGYAAASEREAVHASPATTIEQERVSSNASASSSSSLQHIPNYFEPGPFDVRRLPKLEHTASRIYPFCVGNRCMLRLSVLYPKAKGASGENHRYCSKL